VDRLTKKIQLREGVKLKHKVKIKIIVGREKGASSRLAIRKKGPDTHSGEESAIDPPPEKAAKRGQSEAEPSEGTNGFKKAALALKGGR